MDIEALLATQAGVISRDDFVRVLGRHRFDNAVKSGQVVAVFPRAYAFPWDADQPEIRSRAALVSVGGQAALSHLTTVAARGLPVPPGEPLHVTAYQPRHPRGVPGELVVHRTLMPLAATLVDGLPHVRLEQALVTSWPLLDELDRRAPLIEAYRRRLIGANRLHAAVEQGWWVRDIRHLRELVALVLAGCESELELWGHTAVFAVPGLDDASRQRVVRAGGRTYRLDVAYDEEMLAIELDGRAYHASSEDWERDIARDLALAALGWQTIRLPHRRLFGDVEGVRRDVLAVRAARRLARTG